MASDENWPEVVHKLWRVRQKWARLSRVLIRESTYARILGRINVVVVQVVLLYRSETWVLTPHIGRLMGGFHHRVASRLKGRQYCRGRDGGWLYPILEEAMAKSGLQKVMAYISRRQNTVAQFIATMPIMDLFMVEDRRPGS